MSSADVVKNPSNQENGSILEKVTESYTKCPNPNIKKKCFRKGSRICYTDIENITMLKKIPEKDKSQISIIGQPENEIYDKVDSYRSGESLFKTFTFEQTRDINDPETVKCIEFWKGVMQKNLAPIKCTLIESDKNKSNKCKEKKKRSSTESENVSQLNKSLDGAEKIDFKADQVRIWTQALKEIRNRKLDKLKLYVKERCEYCRDPFTRSFADEVGYDIEEQAVQIQDLNNWQPKDEDQNKNHSKLSLTKRLFTKLKRISATQTTETRVREERNVENVVAPNVSKTRNRPHMPSKQSDSKLSSNQNSGGMPPAKPSLHQSESMRVVGTKTSTLAKTSQVQVPDIKCPCESDTCTCPHKSAANNSITSFIGEARKNMSREDKSDENLSTVYDETCICKAYQHPWTTTICSTEPCIAKCPTIQESSSNFKFDEFLHKVVEPPSCLCGQMTDVVCESENCRNKSSQGSLGSAPQEKKDDSCVCDNTSMEVPCLSETCPTKFPKVSKKCLCGSKIPWRQVKCKSWSCPEHKPQFNRKPRYDEDEIELPKFAPVKEVASTCPCNTTFPWKTIECFCENCAAKQEADDALQNTSKLNIRKNLLRRNKDDQKSRERLSDKQLSIQSRNKCICSKAQPWLSVTCETYCDAKEEPNNKNEKTGSLVPILKPYNQEDDDVCICDNKALEPTCKALKCKNRDLTVEYPPPCICPKDIEENKHFTCLSDTCKMKKIDKSCICTTIPDAPCDNKTCVTKPESSKTLKYQQKRLQYDTKCICKVRGLPTTEDVSCVAPDCPLKKRLRPLPKKTIKPVVTSTPREEVSVQNEQLNKSKCVCNVTDTDAVCANVLCRAKQKKNSTATAEIGEDEEPEPCVCNNVDSDQEVTCRQVKCQKISVNEGGIVTNDKCVCANMDSPCSEPLCPAIIDLKNDKTEEPKKERPYCYICGHYDCISRRKITDGNKVCEDGEDEDNE